MTYIEVPIWLYTALCVVLGAACLFIVFDWIFMARLVKANRMEDEVLSILKKHAKKISEVPGQEKEPDIQITVMPEADEEYVIIKKWLEEEE